MSASLTMYRPTDLPDLRADLLERGEGELAPGSGYRFATLIQSWGPLSVALRNAELFYVAAPMVDLAMAAKDSLPDFKVEPEDVPSADGLIYFAKPIWTYNVHSAKSAVVGAAWGFDRSGHLGVCWLIDRDYFIENRYGRGSSEWTSAATHSPRLIPIENSLWDQDVQSMTGALLPDWSRLFMKSVWLLSQQPVAVTSDAAFDRAAKRRMERERKESPRVRVITLRRSTSTSSSGDSDREYHHQWIVRGHWRQQWYPAREVHRPVWIAPHIKGPEGAPLIGGEKVYAWKR